MARKSPIFLFVLALLSAVLAATSTVYAHPGTPNGNPNGGFDTPPVQAFEEFSIRLEPALGSPRCPVTQQDAAHCEPVGWLSTRSQNFVNIRGEAYLRGSNRVDTGVQMSSSFVASQDDTNVAFQFSAEAKVEDDNPGALRRMFVRALIDGQPAAPSDVVFAKTGHQGTQSFIFTANVDAGIHTVEIQWKVDTEATAYLRDASLLIRMGRDDASEKGTFTTKTAPSGPNLSTNSKNWQDIPGMATPVYVPKGGQVTASFSAEAWTSKGKRMFLRALVDGVAMNPGDVVFVNNSNPTSQAMTFGLHNVSSGWHTVTMQWHTEDGTLVYMGDRSLAVSALPVRTEGGSHYFLAAPSGANVYTEKGITTLLPMKDMAIEFAIPEKGNGEVAVQFSAEIDAVDGGAAIVALVIDGEVQLDGLVQAADGSQPAQVKSFVFEGKGLEPGKHTAEIWFASGSDGQAYVGDRTMNLMSETGFIPDLAEAPKFSGGHIGMDSDYIAGIEPLIGTRKVLAVLIDPGLCSGTVNPDGSACYNQYTVPKGKVESALFGSSPQPGWGLFQLDNVASYFSAMSGGRFSIERAGVGVAGWYEGDESSSTYFDEWAEGTCISDMDSGGLLLISEAVRKADNVVDFDDYDINGDGKLTTDELGIVVVIPRDTNGDGSAIQPLYGKTCGDNERMVLDGVELPHDVAKWNTNLDETSETFQYTTAAHELMHLLGGLDDQHLSDDLAMPVSTYPWNLSLMASNRSSTTHLDPFHKLAFGWVTPVIVHDSSQVEIQTVASSNVVYVLPRYNNPWEEEFYILENRKEGMGFPYYDEDIAESGIAIWHIVTDRIENQLAPVGTTQEAWDDSHIPSDKPDSEGQMARNGIRLLRPFKDFVDGQAVYGVGNDILWTKNQYKLESDTCLLIVPIGEEIKNRLSWADCEASGYNLAVLDFAANSMTVDVLID